MKTGWIRFVIKWCSVAALILVVVVALGPTRWQPRTSLGWEIEHFVGYFAFTLMFCLAWPRSFVVGGVLMTVSVLLEGLQAFTPDRSSNILGCILRRWRLPLLSELFIRVFAKKGGRRHI